MKREGDGRAWTGEEGGGRIGMRRGSLSGSTGLGEGVEGLSWEAGRVLSLLVDPPKEEMEEDLDDQLLCGEEGE